MLIGAVDNSTTLFIAGSTSTTFSGSFAGVGSLEIDNGAALTLTGASNGGNIGTIGGDLELCNCDTGGLTISGGSLTVNSLSMGVAVFGGTLAVINGGTLQIGPGGQPDLLVAGNMIVSGAGSAVTVAGFTGIGVFGPGVLTISNGGVLNSQGGAEIDAFPFGTGTPQVTVLDLERWRRPRRRRRQHRRPRVTYDFQRRRRQLHRIHNDRRSVRRHLEAHGDRRRLDLERSELTCHRR